MTHFARYYLHGSSADGEYVHFLQTALDEDAAMKMAYSYLTLFAEYDSIKITTLDEDYELVLKRGED